MGHLLLNILTFSLFKFFKEKVSNGIDPPVLVRIICRLNIFDWRCLQKHNYSKCFGFIEIQSIVFLSRCYNLFLLSRRTFLTIVFVFSGVMHQSFICSVLLLFSIIENVSRFFYQ